MTPAQQLSTLIAAPGCTLIPGAYDAWTARLVAQAGFGACYMTGFGVSGAFLGAPDIGLMTATQMADNAARMADAAGIPIVADGDTGYGNVLNVRHTVAAYRRAGVAAIQLEDQDFPKRCGHLAGKQVIAAAEMAAKIKTAKDTAGDAVLVIARTDSRSTHGLDEAIDRGLSFRDAGADVVFIEAPIDRDEMHTICRRVTGVPLLANIVEGGKTPYLDADTLAGIGYQLAIYPLSLLITATRAMRATLGDLRAQGKAPDHLQGGFDDMCETAGLEAYMRYAERQETGAAS
ncbi:MAG: isocitrate lyase/PEP mutase family protein [Rhodospirillales bacterium]|nr:isocitrate lyase/PEP mutase family protein [Rhodospirillales bacterium]MCY3857113.1 isocitrate lyase/PEP mutase family protein [Rhodospirillales bacterium]MCY4003500.1 isocitrate lyase/PEP mutase family protein [Rhodospirillales bacterium]